ncbi:Uncharacterised protein [Serratia liquefaciens]|nr:Uncharacterised protein [Serratia liquefaciens]CAI2119661.1 Uncharacterised protein [Serratia liquefaciens]CAI2472913.1 Uncharacterised protein [Serratia liquefaciens]
MSYLQHQYIKQMHWFKLNKIWVVLYSVIYLKSSQIANRFQQLKLS